MKWISVDERLPPKQGWNYSDDGTVRSFSYEPVLAWATVESEIGEPCPMTAVYMCVFLGMDNDHIWTSGDYTRVISVTHWMPLPPPPEAQS